MINAAAQVVVYLQISFSDLQSYNRTDTSDLPEFRLNLSEISPQQTKRCT